ncbi:hypothetical protein MG293_017730 [Ovis ammon polii]|uniref:Uncharacterized protein n=1 Tax=Ovis ammon polii TaxID=230172 RepID=A0AAD4XZW2_OVIAM|nr:hypothetical protein MG293_017730 [Ovis ammon polii]
METQRASLSLGRRSLWLLLLGLVLPSARAQALSYREAVLRAVDQLNEKSSEANLYRLLELDPPPKQDDENSNIPKPVSFRVKETVCPRTSQQPAEQCDFKENGLLKECVGTVTLDQVGNNFDITCAEVTDYFMNATERQFEACLARVLCTWPVDVTDCGERIWVDSHRGPLGRCIRISRYETQVSPVFGFIHLRSNH